MHRASNHIMARARVLVVDDEASLLETMGIILEGNGFEPVTAATVAEAVSRIESEDFDVLLTDLSMPGDGRAVIAAMRRHQPQALIVIITGHVAPEAIPPELRAQADEVLFKPTDIPGLLTMLRHWLGAPG